MELSSDILELIAFNTRPKIENHMVIIMDKSKHDESLAQLTQTKEMKSKSLLVF